MAGSADQLGDIANRFLFENDRVKVWSLDLAPGETSAWHCHERDYVIVVLESDGGVIAEEKSGEHISRGMKPGDVAFRKKGEVHRAVNRGQAQYRNILIELK
jgi:quercetin dioxygenase-like cupin family protein